MEYSEKWETVEELGQGGQGKVYRVIPKSMGYYSVDKNLIHAIKEIGNPNVSDEHREQQFKQFRQKLLMLLERDNPSNNKALKILHSPEDARDYELAEERLKKEIQAMSETSHCNLLNIVDYDLDSKWYVSDYFPKGSLSKNIETFAGNFAKALKTFRPLVEGVAELHKKNIVHRDIKPENIFLGSGSNMILGDFGLVFFEDDNKTRISETFENVGSRDWMPGWAFGIRIEDIKSTFDVFSLGKVLWAMVSGLPKLQLWYFDKPKFNVADLYPNDKHNHFANPLFEKCIVENESDCLADAGALLEEVDKILEAIENDGDKIDVNTQRKCKVCGLGEYQMISDGNRAATSNFGLNPSGIREFIIFTCSNCGNVQLFSHEGKASTAWDK